jgi:hypothetical protein
MPLSQAERRLVAQALLQCFGEDYVAIGRFIRCVGDVAGITLKADLDFITDTWAPFAASGLSIGWWKAEVERFRALGS